MSVQKSRSVPSAAPVPRARKRTRLTREARREEILQAAVRAFCRGGYHGTHVDDVIREAGVARGTFYLHFGAKHEVFAALVDRMLGLFRSVQAEGSAEEVRDIRGARKLVRSHYRALLGMFREHRQLCRLFLDEAAGADKGFETKLAEHRSWWQQVIAGRIRTLRRRGVARPGCDAETAAWFTVGMVEMAARRFVLPEAAPDLDVLAAALADADLAGCCGRTSS